MYRFALIVLISCVAPFARATSCDSSNHHDLPNSIISVAMEDDRGRPENHWIIYRDEFCRAVKIEVMANNGFLEGYLIHTYGDAGENARTRLADVTVDTYAPDGTLLFRELMDGSTLDASGKPVGNCELLELVARLPDYWRKPYEQRSQNESKTPAQGRGC